MKNSIKANKSFAKALTILVLVAATTGYVTWMLGLGQEQFVEGSLRFVYQNISYTAQFAVLILSLLLASILEDNYWITKKNKKMDERQVAIRNRVFEKSYKIAVFGGIAISYVLYNIHQMAETNSGFFGQPVFLITIFLSYALPSMLAAWEKDS